MVIEGNFDVKIVTTSEIEKLMCKSNEEHIKSSKAVVGARKKIKRDYHMKMNKKD